MAPKKVKNNGESKEDLSEVQQASLIESKRLRDEAVSLGVSASGILLSVCRRVLEVSDNRGCM